jgi:hypothetical protein
VQKLARIASEQKAEERTHLSSRDYAPAPTLRRTRRWTRRSWRRTRWIRRRWYKVQKLARIASEQKAEERTRGRGERELTASTAAASELTTSPPHSQSPLLA